LSDDAQSVSQTEAKKINIQTMTLWFSVLIRIGEFQSENTDKNTEDKKILEGWHTLFEKK
jgi:hypothetical protein